MVWFAQKEIVEEDEIEILTAYAISLRTFHSLVSSKNEIHLIFKPLEKICLVFSNEPREEVSLFIQAIKSLEILTDFVDMNKDEDKIIEMIKYFAQTRFYASKQCSAALISHLFGKFSTQKQNECIRIFVNLLRDELPIVRKFASIYLAVIYLIQKLVSFSPPISENDIIFLVQKSASDSQDLVKINSVHSILLLLPKMVSIFIKKAIENGILLIKILCEDSSWRIKFSVCEKFSEFGRILGHEAFLKHLLPYFFKFSKDPESEVENFIKLRCKIAEHIHEIADECCDEGHRRYIISVVKNLINDPENCVKVTLSKNFFSVCKSFSAELIQNEIVPLFMEFLKDKNNEIRINLVCDLYKVIDTVDIRSLIGQITIYIEEISNDKNWRIRQKNAKTYGFIAKNIVTIFIQPKEFFLEIFLNFLLKMIRDPVFTVRTEACEALKEVAEIYGINWVNEHAFPNLLTLQSDQNYSLRITILNFISVCFFIKIANGQMDKDIFSRKIFPLIDALSSDPIPNVRLNSAKTISKCLGRGFEENERLKNILNSLTEDQDIDVKRTAIELNLEIS